VSSRQTLAVSWGGGRKTLTIYTRPSILPEGEGEELLTQGKVRQAACKSRTTKPAKSGAPDEPACEQESEKGSSSFCLTGYGKKNGVTKGVQSRKKIGEGFDLAAKGSGLRGLVAGSEQLGSLRKGGGARTHLKRGKKIEKGEKISRLCTNLGKEGKTHRPASECKQNILPRDRPIGLSQTTKTQTGLGVRSPLRRRSRWAGKRGVEKENARKKPNPLEQRRREDQQEVLGRSTSTGLF